MGEEKIIEELNNKGYFKIKKIKENEVKITKNNGESFELRYSTPIYLKLINTFIDKQIFKNFDKFKIPSNAQILCNLKFDFFYVSTPKDWVHMCDVAMRYVYNTKDPYQALIRLHMIGKDRYEIINIDRNRKIWN